MQLQKHSTQVSYDANYRNHIEPMRGDLPLAEVDESTLSTFTAKLRAKLEAATVNLVLAKVAKVLRFARRVKLITEVPEVSRLPTPRRRRKPVYDDAAIERLLRAARAEGPEGELICLLALDAGLRVSEICGLEWADLDLEAGLITVQNSTYRGEKQTPKGTIATLALSSALKAALVEHRRSGVRGPLVLYRRSGWASVPMALSKGDGTFTVTNKGIASFATWAAEPAAVLIPGDFNGDGRTDLALTGQKAGPASRACSRRPLRTRRPTITARCRRRPRATPWARRGSKRATTTAPSPASRPWYRHERARRDPYAVRRAEPQH